MGTRRKFLSTLGTGLLTAPLALARSSSRRPSLWDMIANDAPVGTPAHKPDPFSWDDSTLTAAWVGHSTILIDFFGTWILTDPVFSERIGLNVAGLFTIGPKRLVAPALSIEELPRIDLILLSHAHLDHLDLPSLKKLNRSVPVIMAANTSDVIADLEFPTVYELDWGKWTEAAGVRVEAIEVKHFGWRYPWEHDRSKGYWDGRSYNAYLISRNGHHIVFGGDTAYQEFFKALASRGICVDLAMMPIGAYDPWIRVHANPEQALAMADHMGAARVFPMHWHTFIQSVEPTMEPIERLKRAAAANPGRIVLDSIGQTWTLGPVPAPKDGDLRPGTGEATPHL